MSDSLFDEPEADPLAAADVSLDAPLAERMRPRDLAAFEGQRHLIGAGKILERALEGELAQSLILWGPPGTGKTTLARLIAARNELRFVPFSAVLSGIKEIKGVMKEAAEIRRRKGRRTLLFIDEIHRFNRAQQDAFLPHVERGDILLIGATTENPSFEVVGPLLSRARTVILQPLEEEQLVAILRKALEDPNGLNGDVRIDDALLAQMARGADGDARRALTLLETAAAIVGSGATIDDATLVEALQTKTLLYDRGGDQHYDLISALHKSVRNSDANAALYWLTRMLEAGEDRRYLLRRLIRMALEDIGPADARALGVCLEAARAWDYLGSPEGELALVHAAAYLARAPKSNANYVAYDAARADVRERVAEQVPLHLRNAVTGLMKGAGYGKGYRYAHDDPAAEHEMSCLPEGLEGRNYFPTVPTDGTDPPARDPRAS